MTVWKSTSNYSRPCFRPKLGHDLREIPSTEYREKHLTPTSRDPELKHKLNLISTQVFDGTGNKYRIAKKILDICDTGDDAAPDPNAPKEVEKEPETLEEALAAAAKKLRGVDTDHRKLTIQELQRDPQTILRSNRKRNMAIQKLL